MKSNYLLPLFFCAVATLSGLAQTPSATATFSATPNGGGYNYSLLLTDTGTTSIGAFWFAWIPGQSYMQNSVSGIQSPAGWNSNIQVVPGGSELGGSVEWDTSSSLLTPGNSLTFKFTSNETPLQLSGISPFYAGVPEGTSTIYSGALLASPSAQIVATQAAVPEPATVPLLLAGVALLWLYRRKSSSTSCPLK